MRAIVIVLTGLLVAWPVKLGAECGWVLWRKTQNLATQGRPDMTAPTWSPESGFDDLGLCEAAAKGSLQGMIDGLKENRIISDAKRQPPDNPTATMVFSDKSVSTFSFVCFPGAFDPRERPLNR
jgi:hypothetical protein